MPHQTPDGAPQQKLTVDLAELDPSEYFAIRSLLAFQPESEMQHQIEFRNITLGRSRAEINKVLQTGVDKLIARGVMRYVTDTQGKQIIAETQWGPMAAVEIPRPVRFVTRMQEGPRRPGSSN